MNRRLGGLLTIALVSSGCGRPVATTPRTPVEPRCSRYEVGDYVVYETTQRQGKRRETIHLMERVDSKDCRKIVIHDWLIKGGERREWKMHLTDTPHNQRNNIADAVEERKGGAWVKVPTGDLRRLFETGMDVDGPTRPLSLTRERCLVAGRPFPCEVKKTAGTVGGEPVLVTCRKSAQFLWTNIGCEFKREAGGEVIFEMKVVDSGKVEPGGLPPRWRQIMNPGS